MFCKGCEHRKLGTNLKAPGFVQNVSTYCQKAGKMNYKSALIQERLREDSFAQILEEIGMVNV